MAGDWRHPTFVLATGAVKGGAWRRLVEFVNHAAGRGHACHVIAYPGASVAEVECDAGIQVHRVGGSGKGRNAIRFNVSVLKMLRGLGLEGCGPVWLGSFAGNSGAGLAWARRHWRGDVRMFTFLRGAELAKVEFDLRRKGAGVTHKWMRVQAHLRMMNAALGASDLVLAQTEVGLREVRAVYRAARGKAGAILPNNINARWILRRVELLKEEGRRDGRFHVVYVGRVNMEVKGIDVLLEVARRVRLADLCFDIVGNGEDLPLIRAAIERYGLNDRVKCHGWLENPLEVMIAGDLVVVPSRSDPLPNVVLEALAVGRAVVGSAVDGIPVFLKHQDLLFEPGDSERLSSIVMRAMTDAGYRAHLENLCAGRADEFRFDWGMRFENILLEAAEGRK